MEIFLKKGGFGEAIDSFFYSKSSSHKKISKKLPFYLAHSVKLEEGFCVDDLFRFLMRHKKDVNLIFEGSMNGRVIEDFIEDINSVPTKDNSMIDRLEFSWAVDCFEKTKDDTSIFEMHMCVYSVIKPDYVSNLEELMPTSPSLESLRNIKHIPVVIKNKFDIVKIDIPDESQGDYNAEKILTASSSVTLYDFLRSFLMVVTLHGTHKEKQALLEAFYENDNDDEPQEDIDGLIAEKRSLIEEYINKEEYEKAAITKKEIDTLVSKKSHGGPVK